VRSLFAKFIEKAEYALTAAVEIYNKPGFHYREETFALLAINAWELLLKARLLKSSNNNPRAIRVYEHRKTKTGRPSKKRFLKRNRAGNPSTLSLQACIAALDHHANTRLHADVKANLEALVAVRDSAAHYINASPLLSKQVLEVASASIMNFVHQSREWFDRDLSDTITLMLPLAFLRAGDSIESVVITRGESRLVKFLHELASADRVIGDDAPYAVAVRVALKMERSKLPNANKVQITSDPDAVKVILTEGDVRERYPWDYKTLTLHCAARYTNFKQNPQFVVLRKPLMGDARYVHWRYLDPGNAKSGKKDFYSPAILTVFDAHYNRK